MATEREGIIRSEMSRMYARGRAAVEAGDVSEDEFIAWWMKRPDNDTLYLMGLSRLVLEEIGAFDE